MRVRLEEWRETGVAWRNPMEDCLMKAGFANYERACKDYHDYWEVFNQVLYDMCRRYPDHSDLSHIIAKVGIISRSLAAGLERQVRSGGGQGEALDKVGEHVRKDSEEVEGIFARLRSVAEPLTPEKLKVIVTEHGRFNRLLMKITREHRSPRSFVAKYMHFHCPAVPIYDSICSAKLRKMVRWTDDLMLFDPIKGADDWYLWHVFRFYQLYQDLKAAGKKVTVRLVDVFLLS